MSTQDSEPPAPTPLEFLQAVYCNENIPLPVRMRAAIEAAPYLHPKLSATAFIAAGGDFAERLERALERSGAVRNAVVIDHARRQMSEDKSDGLSYVLFLAATTVLILILVGWFGSGPDSTSRVARCNTFTLADQRNSDCRPSEDPGRK